jgi:hypothetical protein
MEIVNGFRCSNCTDVDYAKKHIDPAHPKDGPYGINAKDRPKAGNWGPAVQLDGAARGVDGATRPSDPASDASGTRLDFKV